MFGHLYAVLVNCWKFAPCALFFFLLSLDYLDKLLVSGVTDRLANYINIKNTSCSFFIAWGAW